MQKIKKIIILIGIILVLIALTFVILTIINIAKRKNLIQEGMAPIDNEPKVALHELDNEINFYAVKDCVEKYYSYYIRTFNAEDYYAMTYGSKNNNSEAIKQYEQKNATVLYNMLDKKYVEENNITVENIKTKLNKINMSNVNITNIYVSEKDETMNIFLVRGMLKEEKTDNKYQFDIIVNVDRINITFSIIPQQYLEEKNIDIEVGKEINVYIPEEIQKNDNNKFAYRMVNNEIHVKELFSKLKTEIENYPELVYEQLDEEYRNKKFETLEEFKKYLNNNKDRFSKMQIDKYKIDVEEDYMRYVCIDEENKCYIFEETSVMQYKLILDTYTVDLPEFIEKYDSSEEHTKVALNIEKLIEATKDGDYKYVYNKLDDRFKTANFATQEAFEKFIKEKFDAKEDKIEYGEYEEITGVHIYNIKVTDSNENNTKNAKVVMDLKDNRDFVFSFSLEE